MEISNISAYQPMKPIKPAEPTPPPGGNIENRQPPSESSKPAGPSNTGTVNNSALQSLQKILNNYSDMSNLDKNIPVELASQLQNSVV